MACVGGSEDSFSTAVGGAGVATTDTGRDCRPYRIQSAFASFCSMPTGFRACPCASSLGSCLLTGEAHCGDSGLEAAFVREAGAIHSLGRGVEFARARLAEARNAPAWTVPGREPPECVVVLVVSDASAAAGYSAAGVERCFADRGVRGASRFSSRMGCMYETGREIAGERGVGVAKTAGAAPAGSSYTDFGGALLVGADVFEGEVERGAEFSLSSTTTSVAGLCCLTSRLACPAGGGGSRRSAERLCASGR